MEIIFTSSIQRRFLHRALLCWLGFILLCACRVNGPNPAYVSRVNLTSMLVDATVTTTGDVCTDFAFDDALLGPDTILCMNSGVGMHVGVRSPLLRRVCGPLCHLRAPVCVVSSDMAAELRCGRCDACGKVSLHDDQQPAACL